MRVAVVGAAGGIGGAVCRRFASEGAHVLGLDISDEPLRRLEADGAVTVRARVDGTNREDMTRVFAELERLDVLVNAQGITDLGDTKAESLTPETFARVMAVNVSSALWAVQAALPLLVRAGGNIVNVSSLASLRGTGGTAYVISKAALNGLGMALAYQLAGSGVRCNTVAFGPVDTPMLRASVEKLGSRVTEPRPGVLDGVITPDEAAATIAFLASREAGHVTGALMTVDGGRLRH